MTDTMTAERPEPALHPEPVAVPGDPVRPTVGYAVPATIPTSPSAPAEAPLSTPAEQLARLEDKTARIEEKLARSESATQRVVDRFEAASHRMSEVAQQADLMAVKGDVKFIARRVKNLPGFSAVILSSLITAVLTAVITVVIFRYLPGVLGR